MSKALSRMSRRAFIAETICDGRHRKKGPTSMTDSIGRAVEIAGADASFGQRPKSIGARIRRVEDRRLLTGEGMFTADRIIARALHVAFTTQ